MIPQVIRSANGWYSNTGLCTLSFWVTLVCGFILVTTGSSTLLHGVGLRDSMLFVLTSAENPFTFGLFGIVCGSVCCVACHGCYRRARWGFSLASLLALLALFLVWRDTDLGFVLKLSATIVGAKLLDEQDQIRRRSRQPNIGRPEAV